MGKKKADDERNLPADLVAFLTARKELEYDPKTCEPGAVTLTPLEQLKLQRFPMETSGQEYYDQDPHAPGVNSYLVLAVDLIAKCTGDFDPAGLLLWLPIERRYAVWDSSHCTIHLFAKKVTWKRIVADPAPYIDASCGGDGPEDSEMATLVPWKSHPYGKKQVYVPQPA